MVSQISNLLLPIYPELENHLAVQNRTKVPGILKPLFFLDHSFSEDQTQVSQIFDYSVQYNNYNYKKK